MTVLEIIVSTRGKIISYIVRARRARTILEIVFPSVETIISNTVTVEKTNYIIVQRWQACLFVSFFLLCVALRNHLCTFTCQGSDSAGTTAASRSTIGMTRGAIYGVPSVQSLPTCPESWLARTPPDPSAGTIGN